VYKDRYKMILDGLLATVEITAVALLIGILIGLTVAILKVSRKNNFAFKILRGLANVYLTIVRGTPVLVQLFVIYYIILSSTGLSKIEVAMIAFGINSGAYVSEIIRAGILSIDRGQYEAGRSLGLSEKITMTKIILPQAFKNVLPTLVNEFIQLIKETSVAGFIGIVDLSRAGDIIRSQTYEPLVPLMTVASIYLVMVMITTLLMSFLERRLRVSDKR
jgi:His/Glu/Gln/Arg/opine family amino acid ABC transporter permease subunit